MTSQLTRSSETGGNLPQGRFISKISPTSKLNVTVIVLFRCHRMTWLSETNDGIIISTSSFSLQVSKLNFRKS